jgi:hypothetical protein
MFEMEVPACNDASLPHYKIPIETRLVTYLRLWQTDPQAKSCFDLPVEKAIGELLECYICDCLDDSGRAPKGWWSDGVISLKIDQRSHQAFNLLGVTWIDCFGLAPFQIDVELSPAIDSHFVKTVFRLGTLDSAGSPTIFTRQALVSEILAARPCRDKDWAVAVELTPGSTP